MSVAKSPIFNFEEVRYVVASSFVALLAPLLKGDTTWAALSAGTLMQVRLNANVLLKK